MKDKICAKGTNIPCMPDIDETCKKCCEGLDQAPKSPTPFGLLERFVRCIFQLVWRKRLHGRNWFPYNETTKKKATVVRVKGWRTAIIDPPCSGRISITFLFEIFGKCI